MISKYRTQKNIFRIEILKTFRKYRYFAILSKVVCSILWYDFEKYRHCDKFRYFTSKYRKEIDMFGRRRASGPPSKCHPLDTQVHREPPYSRGHPPLGRRRAGRPPVLKVSPPGYTGPPRTLGSRGWLFWHPLDTRVHRELPYSRGDLKLTCEHSAICSTPEYWFAIVIYSTWQLAAHQNISFLMSFTALGDLQHARILIIYCNLQHLAICSTHQFCKT